MWKLANIEETTGNYINLTKTFQLFLFNERMKCQQNKELECEELHVKMELTWFWKWLHFLFHCCFYFPHARKKIENTSHVFAKGVLSLISKLRAKRTSLYREKISSILMATRRRSMYRQNKS